MKKKNIRKISPVAARAKKAIVRVNWRVRNGVGISDCIDFASFVAGMQFTLNLSRVTVCETSPQSWISYKSGHDAFKAAVRRAIKTLKDEEDLMIEY